MKRISSIVCVLVLIFSLCPLYAAASAEPKTAEIVTADDLEQLARDCALDSYSEGLTVYLRTDIDLSESDFAGIPYFAGTFVGGGHTLSGLSLTGDGSRQGVFRTLAEGASVTELNVQGTVTPGGSACMAGGIVGENYGTLVRCSFSGTVSGTEQVGGIAGVSAEGASITACSFGGDVTGEHRVGGIVGDNSGFVYACDNSGLINTVEIDTAETVVFDISSLTEVEEEDVLDITDIGGIAGYNCGILRRCENTGDVGYPRVGYNIGGICGRGTGIVYVCTNSGTVQGRKDVGGILGQLEPQSEWDFSEDKLADLNSQVSALGDDIEAAAQDLDAGADAAASQLSNMSYYINLAGGDLQYILNGTMDNVTDIAGKLTQVVELLEDALCVEENEALLQQIDQIRQQITQGGDDSEGASSDPQAQIEELLPLLDSLITAGQQNIESGTLSQMSEILSSIYVTTPDFSAFFSDFSGAVDAASGLKYSITGLGEQAVADIQSVVEQVDRVYTTFFTTAEDVATINTDWQVDISSVQSGDLTGGAAVDCMNFGDISGDTNVGGIAGSIAWEVSFDMEDELDLSDYLFTDAKYLISAVVDGCESYGDVTAKKECAGGIAGNMSFGAVRNSLAGGNVSVTDGDRCGGIAGQSDGSVSDCWARTTLSGGAYVGGIAGQGSVLENCVAYTQITQADEYAGAIAGWAEGSVSGCRYVQSDYGAVDGVSYAGDAEEISYEEMAADDTVPAGLKTVTVTFMVEDATYYTEVVPFGGSLSNIPEVPDNGSSYWRWDDFKTDDIHYSFTVTGAWHDPDTTISSGEEPPLVLIEGSFDDDQQLTLGEYIPRKEELPTKETKILTAQVLAAYKLSVNDAGDILHVRMHIPQDGTLYVRSEDGAFEQTEYTRDGTYICFDMPNGGRMMFLDSTLHSYAGLIIGLSAGGAVLAAGVVITIVCVRKAKKKKRAAKAAEGAL